jgi:methylmalonyl-CoA mutase, C-terminal domain
MDSKRKRIRIVLAKLGLDGHDRGLKVTAQAMRDAGMEVIYLGLRQSPESVAEAALQEDADIIGISSLSGAHMVLLPALNKAVKDRELYHIKIIAGGVIPEEDRIELVSNHGVSRIFGPGTSAQKIISYIRSDLMNIEDL